MAKRKTPAGRKTAAARKPASRAKTPARTAGAKKAVRKAAARRAVRKAASKKAVRKAVTKKAVRRAVTRKAARKAVAKRALRTPVARKAPARVPRTATAPMPAPAPSTTPPPVTSLVAAPVALPPAPAPAAAPPAEPATTGADGAALAEDDEEEPLVPGAPSSLLPGRQAGRVRAVASPEDELAAEFDGDNGLRAGDLDVNLEQASSSGDETPGGDNPTPDQDVVDLIGRSMGVEYDDAEELRGADKIAARDRQRWELNPASAEDFKERGR